MVEECVPHTLLQRLSGGSFLTSVSARFTQRVCFLPILYNKKVEADFKTRGRMKHTSIVVVVVFVGVVVRHNSIIVVVVLVGVVVLRLWLAT